MNLHFVRFIRGLQNFLAIPIMNTLAGFMINDNTNILLNPKVKLANSNIYLFLFNAQIK